MGEMKTVFTADTEFPTRDLKLVHVAKSGQYKVTSSYEYHYRTNKRRPLAQSLCTQWDTWSEWIFAMNRRVDNVARSYLRVV